MNKNIKKIGTMVLVAIVAVGSYFVAGTYAKYTSTVAGSDTAKVAKWAWKINSADMNLSSTGENSKKFTLDLFSTAIKDSNGTANETDMSATTHMVAPGTSGSFQISVQNLSDVNAEYSANFSENKGSAVSDANIEYAVKVGDAAISAYGDIDTLDQAVATLAHTNGAKTITVYWRWVYENGTGDTLTANDAADTAVGIAAAAAETDADRTITITADVKFTQVD